MLETKAYTSVPNQQLLVKTSNFLHISLKIDVSFFFFFKILFRTSNFFRLVLNTGQVLLVTCYNSCIWMVGDWLFTRPHIFFTLQLLCNKGCPGQWMVINYDYNCLTITNPQTPCTTRWHFSSSCQPFWMLSNNRKESRNHMSNFVSSTVPADVLAPLGARASAGNVPTKVGFPT